MKRKQLTLAVVITVLAVLLSACGSSSKLTMGTGREDGDYYGLGDAMAYYIGEDEDAELTVTVAATDGSVANIQGIDGGDYKLGIVRADVMMDAWNGTRAFDGAAVQTFRVVAELYTEAVQLVTLNSELDSVADLAGHIVSVSTEGSGTYWTAMDVLTAAGLNAEVLEGELNFINEETGEALTTTDVLVAAGLSETDVGLRYLNMSESIEALTSGTVDAVFIVDSAPTSAITELCAENTVTFIPLDSGIVTALTEDNSSYSAYTLTKKIYTGQTSAVSTISMKTVLIASAEAEKDTIYNVTKIIFENMSNISEKNDMGAELSIASAVSNVDIPYHSGAALYFAEQGYRVATE